MDATVDRVDDNDGGAACAVDAAHALAQRIAEYADTGQGHWSCSAQALIGGTILYLLHRARRAHARVGLRGVLDELVVERDSALWSEMAALVSVVPAAANVGKSMLQRSDEERAGIAETARTMLERYIEAGFEPDCERAMHVLVLEAHRFAAVAVQHALTGFLRARLSCKYALHSEIAARLVWLLDATNFLFAAVGGAANWDRWATRRQLARLDAELGPGSLWRFAWSRSDREDPERLERGDESELPRLLATYDAAFSAHFRAGANPETETADLN